MLYQILDNLPIGWFVRLAILRLAAQWRSILTIIIGVLLTAMIGASIPLYTNAIAQIGMIQRLEQRETQDTQIYTRTSSSEVNDAALIQRWRNYDTSVAEAAAATFDAFPNWLENVISWGEGVTMQVVQNGADIDNTYLGVASYAQLENFVEILEGELPTTTDGEIFPVAISDEVAVHLDLSLGDQLTLDQRGWDTSLPIVVEVTAILRENNPDSPYWMSPSPFRIERNPRWQAYVFTTRENLERIAIDFVPQTRVQMGWRMLFNHDRLPFTRLDDAKQAITTLQPEIKSRLEAIAGGTLTVIYNTELPEIFTHYQGEVDVLNVPFALILLQLVALVMFFLIVIGSLVRRSERREIGMLKSRGVLDRQIIMLRGAEALIICIISVIAAPTFARAFLMLLTPIFTDSGAIPLEIQSNAYVYAGIASLAAFVVLIVTLIPVLRTPLILTSGQADREPGQVWWQRYYLDVVMLVIGLVALVQMVNTENSIAAEDQTTDPLMLLVPTLLIIALGSVSLRIFPSLMRYMASFFYRRTAIEPILASWQVSREPLHYGRIAFLLALAISVGWFAFSFQSTVINSQSDQAVYQTGADLRISYTGDLMTWLQNRDDVTAISDALRFENISTPTRGYDITQTTLLAIDADTFADAADFRDDLGSLDVPQFEQPLPQTGVPVDTSAEIIHLELLPLETPFFRPTTTPLTVEYAPYMLQSMFIMLRFSDEQHNVWNIPLPEADLEAINDYIYTLYAVSENPAEFVTPPYSQLPNHGWLQYDIPVTFPEGAVYFEGITIQEYQQFGSSGGISVLQLRNLQIGDTPITDDWTFVNERATFNQADELPDGVTEEALKTFVWTKLDSTYTFAHWLNYPEVISTDNTHSANHETPAEEIVAIPALISPSFAAEMELSLGQKFQLYLDQSIIWLEVAKIQTYFPTLYNDDVPFIVVEQDALLYTMLRRPTATNTYEHEAWIQLDSPTDDFVAELEMLDNVVSITRLDDALDNLQADLLSVGLIGLLFFSAVIGFLLGVVSLVTYAALNVQDRRTDLAVLRALGLNMPRLISSLAIEQILVIIISLLLGLGIGILLSIQVIPVLSINTAGGSITPPFLIRTEIGQLLLYSSGILLVMLAELAISSWLIRRLATMQALRTGE